MSKEIPFSLSIYRLAAIVSAMQLYAGHAEFSYTESEHDICVRIQPKNEAHAQLIIDSFCNHVLFETIVAYRAEKGGEL